MPTYKAKFGDQIIPITADSPEQAALMARLKFAGMQGVQQAEAGAESRSQEQSFPPLESTGSGFTDSAYAGMGYPSATNLGEATRNLATGASIMAAPSMVPASAPAAMGLAKDLALYGAAEGAEKVLGLPSWTGEALGAINPTRQIGKLLLGGMFGGAKKAATQAAAKGATEAVAKNVASEAPEVSAAAVRKIEADIAIKQARLQEIANREARAAEKHAAWLQSQKAKAAGRPVSRTRPAEPEVLPDEAVSLVTETPTPTTPAPAPPKAPSSPARPETDVPYHSIANPDPETIALQIQQKSGILRSGLTPDARKVVAEELAKVPPEIRTQVEELLFKGHARVPTIYSPTPGAPKPAPYKGTSKPLKDPVMEFARQEGRKPGQRWGERMYFELDASGKPIRRLNGPQAATAIARKGGRTTWVKNLWGDIHDAKSAPLD